MVRVRVRVRVTRLNVSPLLGAAAAPLESFDALAAGISKGPAHDPRMSHVS